MSREETRMNRTRTAVIGSLAVTAATAFALGGLLQPSAQADADVVTFTLTQEPPTLFPVDMAAKGDTEGDMLLFEAKVSGEEDMSGTITGLLITADIPDASGDTTEDRLGQLTFDFGGGNSLVVVGKTIYPDGAVEMAPGTPQLRAIVGGTGIYLGARGQLESLRQEDGSYVQTITLVDE